MLWLSGPAGAGKTALAKTIAEIYKACGRLLGTFFFSRTKAGRSSGATLVPTLAYQLMLSLPSTRLHILNNIKEDLVETAT
jgi:ABC-type branched-subunit amino acid transport system ATPase component